DARVPLLVQLGSTQEALGQLDYAQGAFLEALRLQPEHLEAFDALNRLYEASGAYDRVVQLCEARAGSSPAEVRLALHARAGELASDKRGAPGLAESLSAKALEIDPRPVQSLVGLAQLYRRQGALRRAARLILEAVEQTQNRLLRTRLLVDVGE